jgi:hypothetical protein
MKSVFIIYVSNSIYKDIFTCHESYQQAVLKREEIIRLLNLSGSSNLEILIIERDLLP